MKVSNIIIDDLNKNIKVPKWLFDDITNFDTSLTKFIISENNENVYLDFICMNKFCQLKKEIY